MGLAVGKQALLVAERGSAEFGDKVGEGE